MLTTPSACANCNTTGLPILPVRYTVVPTELKPTMPSGISGERVKDVALDSKQYQYGLRTLRGGFVYLFYEKGARGKNYWEVYAVSHDGHLTSFVASPEPPESIFCENNKHNVPRTAYICIESPEKCGKVWIAFTQRLWRVEAFNQYTTDAALRAKRMQSIMPADWINAPQHPHAAEATQANLEHVLEYRTDLPQTALSPNTIKEISKKDGSYEPVQLRKQTTRYPAYMRNATVNDKGQPITPPESKHTVRLMHGSGKRPQGGSHPPMLLALWDGIGITHEMNGYRNEAAGRIKQYGDEREVEITALAAIEAAKKAMEDKAEAGVETKEQLFKDPRMLDPGYLKEHALKLPQPQQALRLDDLNLIEQWNAQEVPTKYGTSVNQLISLYTQTGWQDPKSLPAMVARRDEARNPIIQQVNEYLRTRDPKKQATVKQARAESWPKYEKKLNLAVYNAFKTNYDKFLEAADNLIDARTVELIKWLEAPLFIDTLEDFHNTNIDDGVAFEDAVGDAIFAMSSSPSGAAKIKTWVEEAKASSRSNIAWRAVALNQKEAIKELDHALAAAKQGKQTPLTESAWEAFKASIKQMQRLADTYKKANTVLIANDRAIAANAPNATAETIRANKAFGVPLQQVNTRGMDKIAVTIGDAVFKFFRVDKASDFLSEKIIQHVFSVRAFVDPSDSNRLILAEAKEQGLANKEILSRFSSAKPFIEADTPEIRKQQAATLRLAWDNFKTSPQGLVAVKEARLAIVVGLIEGVNFSKLWIESEGKPRQRAMITASALAITAAMADVAAAPAKSLFGNEAVSYQKIKLIGGVLGGTASMVMAGVDFGNMERQYQNGQLGLALLFLLKSLTGTASGILTLTATFSYSAGVLERLTGRTTANALTKVGKKAGAIIARRILFMAAGAWITVGLIVLEVIIWAVSDNDLQNWCEQCVFGISPNQNAVDKKPEEQMQTFGKALVSVN